MQLSEIDRLLDPAPMRPEAGRERFADGVLHVACRTDLHGCGGAMFEWWFRSRPNTQQHVWWHPADHVSSEWIGGSAETHVGSIHKIEERFGALPAAKLHVHFHDASEFFDAAACRDARADGRTSAAVCGRAGVGWGTPKLPGGRLLGGRLLHIARDTAWGSALRSRFFMGQDMPLAGKRPGEVVEPMPDAFAEALLLRCHNEFTFLSRFLPSLFIAENRATHEVALPW